MSRENWRKIWWFEIAHSDGALKRAAESVRWKSIPSVFDKPGKRSSVDSFFLKERVSGRPQKLKVMIRIK